MNQHLDFNKLHGPTVLKAAIAATEFFDMSRFIHDCNTPSCMAGWATYILHPEMRGKLNQMTPEEHVYDLAKLLKISVHAAMDLAYPGDAPNGDGTVRRSSFWNRNAAATANITAAEAIAAIDKALDHARD
jgi:hypothetical protein